jgi:HEPN domain-containing protein
VSLTVKGQVDYWLKLSKESLLDMRAASRSGRRVNALFCGHLALEKMLKALCAVKRVPSNQIWGHSLVSLTHKANLILTNQQIMELGTITSFNLAARYDDYKRQFAQLCTPQYTKQWIDTIEAWYIKLRQTVLLERALLPNNTPAI